MSSVKETMYKKRAGTSSMSGQLYKTKLVGLVLFKLLHDERFEYFYLASNVDEIGCFDDFCFKAKIKGIDRPILVFIQAKHKEDNKSFVDFDDACFYDSYTKVIQKFYSNSRESKDNIFNGKFDENECIFIVYINAKHTHDSKIQFDNVCASTLNYLLATGKGGTHLQYTDKMIEVSAEEILKQEIVTLAEHFTRFLNVEANQSMQIMLDNFMLRYHVLLARSVVNISNIQSEDQNIDTMWRILTFREDFFETNNKSFILLRKAINKQILQHQVNEQKKKEHVVDSKAEQLLRTFFENPCASTLGALIGTYIEYKDGTLVFTSQSMKSELEKLDQISLSQATIEEAEAIAAKNILLSLELKVPVTFGNIDLVTFEQSMDYLINSIVNLCDNFKLVNGYKVVTLDETIEDRLQRVNGGLAGAVGNLLVYDENTKLLQFTNNCTPQQHHAKILLEKLKSNVTDLYQYRFYVKATVLFPKVSFDFSEEAKEILDKIVVYAQQSNQNEVEKVLRKQIENYHHSNISLRAQVRPESIFLNYHAAIQEWWLLKDKAFYLTKETQIYQEAINNIIKEPLINLFKYTFHMKKMKNIEYTTESLKSLRRLSRQKDETDELTLAAKTIIVTDVTTLTTIKVIQYLSNEGINNYAIVDLSYTINLSSDDFCALKVELQETDKYIIVICEKLQNGVIWYEKYLKEIAQAVEEKQKVIITSSIFADMVRNAFSSSEEGDIIRKETANDEVIYDKPSLVDFIQDSQKSIITNRKIIFQGEPTNLDLLFDDTALAFIEGSVLNKVILNETVELGEPVIDPNYDEIKHLYLDRALEYTKSELIPGNICVLAVDYILGDYSPCKQVDDYIDSLLSIDLLEDPNNYTRPVDTGNSSKDPFYIDFHFACRLNRKKIKEDYISMIISLDKQDELTYRLSINTNDLKNKIWIVRIQLIDCSKLVKKWQEDKRTDKDTLKTLRHMCEGVILDNIMRNENSEIRSTTGALDTETINNLFKESDCAWHTFSSQLTMSHGLRKDSRNDINSSQDFATAGTSKKPPLSSNDTQFISQKKYICKLDDTPIGADISVDKLDLKNACNIKQNCRKTGTLKYGNRNPDMTAISNEEEKRSNVNEASNAHKDFIYKVSLTYTHKFYSVVPNITVTTYKDESNDMIIDDEEANNENSSQKNIIMIPWYRNNHLSEFKDIHVYNFHINCNYKYQMDVKTFKDIKDDVVLLTGKAGVGKSTLLAHLSQKQKKLEKNTWIVKVKLVNYSGLFRKWQDENIVIDTLVTLKFICQVILKNRNITLALKESCDKVYLEKCSGDDWDIFNVNMFLHFYNERKLFLLFDGYDEIYPDYKDVVLKLLQVVKNFPQRNKMWVTSRPYNTVLPDLERHFGRSYKMSYFNKTEQAQYLSKFWIKLILERSNACRLEALLEYLSYIITVVDIKLKMICYDFYNFILANYLSQKSSALKFYCERIEEEYKSLNTSVSSVTMSAINEFLGTPLLMYMSAIFFVNEIININNVTRNTIDYHRNFSVCTMYEHFIKIKLRKILFQDKCGLNVDMPLINDAYKLELQESMAIHKKLGAHAIFGSPIFIKFGIYLKDLIDFSPFRLDTEAGKKEFNHIIDRIRLGKERLGLVTYVTSDGVPVFIHKTFAEYFAFEYVYEIVKNKNFDYKSKKLLLAIVVALSSNNNIVDECGDAVFSMSGIQSWMSAKGLIDNELKNIIGSILQEWPLIQAYLSNININRFVSLNMPHSHR